MPEEGKYKMVPRPESIASFVKLLEGKDFISEVERNEDQVYVVRRPQKGDLKVYLTNIYIVGIADVHEILGVVSNLNAIVTMSAWNGYSNEAKAFCREHEIGLFKYKEFLGAVYYHGERFLDYEPPDHHKKSGR